MMFPAGWKFLQLKGWIGIKESPVGVEDLVLGLKECENSHTLMTTTTGYKNPQKEVNNQTDDPNQCSVPSKGPFFTGSWSWMKSRARHTLSNKTQLVRIC